MVAKKSLAKKKMGGKILAEQKVWRNFFGKRIDRWKLTGCR